MIRHCKLDINYLVNLKDASGSGEYRTIQGVKVKITSERYRLFKESRVCVKCGIEGKFLAVEKFLEEIKNYHINMYGISEDGQEVLMTKDHIIPKSKGGKNHHSNYQTMCTKCNINKGNGKNMTLRKLFDDYVYNKTRRDIKKIDKLCVELDIEPNDFWYYYLKSKGNFSEVDFLTEMLTHFHYYLDTLLITFLKLNGIDFKNFYFSIEENNIKISQKNIEFTNLILNSDISLKKHLMENKIFAYFMKRGNVQIFTSKEIRALKLENLSN